MQWKESFTKKKKEITPLTTKEFESYIEQTKCDICR